jgi:hypothetical protein
MHSGPHSAAKGVWLNVDEKEWRKPLYPMHVYAYMRRFKQCERERVCLGIG